MGLFGCLFGYIVCGMGKNKCGLFPDVVLGVLLLGVTIYHTQNYSDMVNYRGEKKTGDMNMSSRISM